MRDVIIPELDAAEYLSWEQRQPGKFELHEGFVIGFAGATFRHDKISDNLIAIFKRGYPAPCLTFTSNMKIRVAEKTFYYADAGVVCVEVADEALFVDRPRVVAEVLSPATRSYDLVEKRAAYRRLPSLEAYVIVHTEQRKIEIDTRYGDGWQTATFTEGFLPLAPDCTVDEVYARTSLL